MKRLWQKFWAWAREEFAPAAMDEDEKRLLMASALEAAQEAAEFAGEKKLRDALTTLTVLWAAGFEGEAGRVLDRVAAPLLGGSPRTRSTFDDTILNLIADGHEGAAKEVAQDTIKAWDTAPDLIPGSHDPRPATGSPKPSEEGSIPSGPANSEPLYTATVRWRGEGWVTFDVEGGMVHLQKSGGLSWFGWGSDGSFKTGHLAEKNEGVVAGLQLFGDGALLWMTGRTDNEFATLQVGDRVEWRDRWVVKVGAGPEESAPSAPPARDRKFFPSFLAAQDEFERLGYGVLRAKEHRVEEPGSPGAWGVIYDRGAKVGARYAASPLPDAGTGHPYAKRAGRALSFPTQLQAHKFAGKLNQKQADGTPGEVHAAIEGFWALAIIAALLSACAPAGADASKRTVTLFAKDRPLSEVIDQAAQQVGCNLRSKSGVGNEPVTVDIKVMPLEPTLDAWKRAYGLTWRIDDRGLGCDLWVERPARAPLHIAQPSRSPLSTPFDPAPYHRPRWRVRAGLDTRAQVLSARCRQVKWDPKGRHVVAATCPDLYAGGEIASTAAASEIAIDHLVPAEVAWKRRAWAPGEFQTFFDDERNLVITDPIFNEAKGARMPDGWCPPDADARPRVAARFRAVVAAYGIPLTPAEESGLASWSVGLCGGGR